MMNLIKAVLEKVCCKHDWEELKSVSIYDDPEDKFPASHRFVYVCKKCGKIKIIEV